MPIDKNNHDPTFLFPFFFFFSSDYYSLHYVVVIKTAHTGNHIYVFTNIWHRKLVFYFSLVSRRLVISNFKCEEIEEEMFLFSRSFLAMKIYILKKLDT
jgi:hypothetical protein